jgi:DNA-binding transcriptional LysR family regulator
MDWDKLRAFDAAAQAGSFTHAAEILRLSQSAVSRQITALEQSLKIPLFHRHARGLKLTEQGALLHGAVREMVARMSMVESRLLEQRDKPCGPLTISTTVAFGAFWLAPRLREFHDLYPEITPGLLLDGGTADLAMGEADVAIRMSAPQSADLVQRRILCSRSFAYASPDYLRRRGIPVRPTDLSSHLLVARRGGRAQEDANTEWLAALASSNAALRPPVAVFDSTYCLFQALTSGLGIGSLPHFMATEAVGLIKVLPDFVSPREDGFFVYPTELRQSKRIAVFRDFLIRKISEARLNHDPCDNPKATDDGGTPLSRMNGAAALRTVRA